MSNNDKLGAETGKPHAQAALTVEPADADGVAQENMALASLAGGSLDAMQSALAALPGVEAVIAGQMCYPVDAMPTGRRAACQMGVLQLRYNPVQLSYADVLAAFFASHDPTQPYEQAPLCQRSTIYFHGPLQEQMARREMALMHTFTLSILQRTNGNLILAECRLQALFWWKLIFIISFTLPDRRRLM